ncbi:MAG: lipoprotein [Burkholderiaceae bacterium]|nr:lipoprotein [Burkholderiaceae bacterium]
MSCVLALTLLGACGQKGPLKLPPAAAPSASAASSSR